MGTRSTTALGLCLTLWPCAGCAGYLDPRDFQSTPAEGPAKGEPVHVVRTAHGAGGELSARWSVLLYPDGHAVREGRAEEFYPDGRTAALRHYRAGEPVGEWKTWYPDGTLRSSYEFVPGRSTPMRFFHPSGELSAEGPATMGLRDGHWTFWYPGGGVRQEGAYRSGLRTGLWTLRWPGGALRSRGYYRADRRVGEWKHWSEVDGVTESDWTPPQPEE